MIDPFLNSNDKLNFECYLLTKLLQQTDLWVVRNIVLVNELSIDLALPKSGMMIKHYPFERALTMGIFHPYGDSSGHRIKMDYISLNSS